MEKTPTLDHEIVPNNSPPLRGNDDTLSSRSATLLVLVVFIMSLLGMVWVFAQFPELDEEDTRQLRLPREINDAKDLGRLLSKYKDSHYYTVLSSYFLTYIFLQTFAIPGSIFLSILSGFLFPTVLALSLVCTCSGIGATFCYLLSSLIGRGLVRKYIPERAEKWREQVSRHKDDLINYIIFLRMTPFLPNWFINIVSPVIGVPITPFFIATVIGVAPPSFLFIRAGTTLYELTTATSHISWFSIGMLAVLSVLSILPVLFRRRLREKLD
ncbi:transmembrane protein 41B-like [Dysidea avara]|uniref:transmembrane protein 41B-like n=1 Tax=Dysidea avara TaxID=196820 RepID=UPI00331F1EBB